MCNASSRISPSVDWLFDTRVWLHRSVAQWPCWRDWYQQWVHWFIPVLLYLLTCQGLAIIDYGFTETWLLLDSTFAVFTIRFRCITNNDLCTFDRSATMRQAVLQPGWKARVTQMPLTCFFWLYQERFSSTTETNWAWRMQRLIQTSTILFHRCVCVFSIQKTSGCLGKPPCYWSNSTMHICNQC